MGATSGGEAGTARSRYHGQTWGDFEFSEPIGSGPRGTVYRARQLSLDRPVAVKVLDLKLSEDSAFRRRFLREAVSVAQIVSPHVAHIHYAAVRDGHPWFAMELVDGPDLRARLRDGLRLGHAAAFDLLLQAARGLAAASRQGIVHRDLKPSNLLVDAEGTLKISDFGLVGLAGESAVRPSELPYASPERRAGQPCDERSDIYALGAIAYELLAGVAPGTTADDGLEPLRARDRKLHADLEAAVLRCLRRDPELRWSSAQALVDALEALLLSGKVLRRTRWERLLAAAAAALVAGGSAWAWAALPPRTAVAPIVVQAAPRTTAPQAAVASSSAPSEGADGGSTPPPIAPHREAVAVRAATEAPSAPAAAEQPRPESVAAVAAPTTPGASAAGPGSAPTETDSVAAISAPQVRAAAPPPATAAAAEDAPAAVEPTAAVDAAAPAAPAEDGAEAPAAPAAALAGGGDDIGHWADLRVLGVVQRFRWCPPGVYLMGSPDDERRRSRDEDIHQVTLTRGFWIADTECSQALWITVMGSSPSAVQDLSHPVERVAWDQAHVFIARLNRLCPGADARLPTEAEWEYACRAGGADDTPLESCAWYERSSGGATHPIAQLQPNAWGLFDMRGNVGEWCEDGYGPYHKPVVIDPPPRPGSARVVRGGSCRDDAADCRPARRGHQRQQSLSEWVGMRLALGCGERLPGAPAAKPAGP